MLLFSGWGSIAGLVGAGLVFWLSEAITSSERFAAIVAGVALFAFGWWLHAQPDRILVDSATEQEVVLRERHTIFWIPVQYWGVVIAIGGIVGF